MEYKELKEIAKISLGLTHSPEYSDTGIPFLSVKDITGGNIEFNECHYISEEEYNKLPKGARPETGDILFCRVGTIGKPIIITEDIQKFGIFVSLGFLTITDKNFKPEFIKYWMESKYFMNQVKQHVSGASLVNLNTGWLSKFLVPCFSIETQEEIIQKMNNINETLTNRKKYLENLDYLVDSKLNELINNTKSEPRKLGECLTIVRGASPRPINKFISDEGVNWIKIGDAEEGELYINSTKQKITEEGAKKSRRVSKGELILSNSMSFGRPYILNIDGCVHDGWLILRDYEKHFDKIFLCKYLGSKYIYNKFKTMATGGVVNNLNSDLVRSLDVIIPNLDEQKNFMYITDTIEKLREKTKKEINYLNELLESISNKYYQ